MHLLAVPALLSCLAPQDPHAAPEGAIAAWVEALLDEMEHLYRELHAHPELSFAEQQTAARVAEAWSAAGLSVTTRVGGHGVVAVLENGAGPTLMLRCDMDALPLEEATGLPFASKVRTTLPDGQQVGVMHACGHDVHMASLIGTVRVLAAHRDRWRGRLVCIGQPAEERGSGARAMLGDGLFERFGKPDFALALHVSPTLPAGSIGFVEGYAMANVDSVDITVFGRGGHGAYPHRTIDPIVQAAQLVLALQTIHSREIDPREPAVITVGSIHGGSKHNIIPDSCHLQVTVRSYTPEVREQLLAAIRRKAEANAASFGAPPPKVETSEPVTALYNDPALVRRVVPALRAALGDERLVPAEPVMGAEDFAYFGAAGVPVFMFWLGAVAPEAAAPAAANGAAPPPLHSPTFAPDARTALRTGMIATVAGALELLSK
jgi:hippurate hydrolase